MTNEIAVIDPEYVYQTMGRERLVHRRKAGLVAPPGAGKTRILLGTVKQLGCELTLVVCSGSAIASWKRQIPQWYGNASVVHVGAGKLKQPKDRIAFWSKMATGEYGGFVLISYAIFRQDFVHIYGKLAHKARHWDAVIADEYHKAFRNRKTQTFKQFRTLARSVKYVFPTSGTALGRHPGTLWTLLHICNPQVFSSYWKFVTTYCLTDDGEEGSRILGPKPSMVESLKQVMDTYLAYIPDEVVADQLPEGKRMTFDVTMTNEQRTHYERLVEDMMLVTDDDIIMTSNTLALQVMLRQLLCCPKLIKDNWDFGGGFEAICDTLEEQPHIIIFVPFREACDIFAQELVKRGYHAEAMYGGMSPEEQAAMLQRFRIERGIIVCTIQYAESFDCETCDTSYFLGYIHMLDQHTQAEGRTRRAISKHKFVKWYYVCVADTVDELALLNIGQSLSNIRKVLERPEAYIQALKGITTN